MAGAPGVDERALLVRLGQGDEAALAPLMERHAPRVYRIALSYLRDPDDALDAVQEVFVKAYRHAASWNPQSEPGPWITRIAVNHVIDRYRRARRRRALETPLEDLPPAHATPVDVDTPSPERQALGREVSDKISRALLALPAKQRAVFVLRHHHDLSLPEIAETLGLSLGTVKSSLLRALFGLRQRLEGLRP